MSRDILPNFLKAPIALYFRCTSNIKYQHFLFYCSTTTIATTGERLTPTSEKLLRNFKSVPAVALDRLNIFMELEIAGVVFKDNPPEKICFLSHVCREYDFFLNFWLLL